MQNDGYHLPTVDQHGILMDLLKIVKNRILPLFCHSRDVADLDAYDLSHRVMDVVPPWHENVELSKHYRQNPNA